MTAVEWLFEKLWQLPKDKFTWYNVLEQAKEMEKEQITDAWRNGDNDSMYSPKELDKQAEEYYNETYGSKGSDERIVEATKTIISQTEISDEEIEKAALEYFADYKGGASEWEILAFIMGMKKYREQLKSK